MAAANITKGSKLLLAPIKFLEVNDGTRTETYFEADEKNRVSTFIRLQMVGGVVHVVFCHGRLSNGRKQSDHVVKYVYKITIPASGDFIIECFVFSLVGHRVDVCKEAKKGGQTEIWSFAVVDRKLKNNDVK